MAERDALLLANHLLRTGNNARLAFLLKLVIDDLDQCLRDRQNGSAMHVAPDVMQPIAPRSPR
jgi:hypothetical protein